MQKSDLMFYSAYLLLFILLGVWLVIWATEYVDFTEMFLLWATCAGILMILLGTIRTKEAPHGSSLLIGSGMFLTIITLMLLAMLTDVIGGWLGAGIGIILIGITGFIILFMNMSRK